MPSKIKEIEHFFYCWNQYLRKEEQNTYKDIASLHYSNKTLLVFSGAYSGVSLCSITTVICTHFESASVSVGIVFLSVMGLPKCYWKRWEGKK